MSEGAGLGAGGWGGGGGVGAGMVAGGGVSGAIQRTSSGRRESIEVGERVCDVPPLIGVVLKPLRSCSNPLPAPARLPGSGEPPARQPLKREPKEERERESEATLPPSSSSHSQRVLIMSLTKTLPPPADCVRKGGA